MKNNTEILCPFNQLLSKVTSCKPLIQYHNQDIDLDAVKIQTVSVTAKVPQIALL